MWYRVFGLNDNDIQPAELLEHLQHCGLEVQGHFRGDDEGWFEAEFVLDGLSVTVNRYLVTEEGVRQELNNWAAWIELESSTDQRESYMQRIISSQQMFTMEIPDAHAALESLCLETCRFLADRTQGMYQVDGQGFFSSEGNLLIGE